MHAFAAVPVRDAVPRPPALHGDTRSDERRMTIKTALSYLLAWLLGHRSVTGSVVLARLLPNTRMYTRAPKVTIGLANIIIGPVELGSNIMTAQHVVISAINHQYANITVPIKDQGVQAAKITIEDDCWIGAQCVITAGITIGRHCVVAGGSVVTKSIPPYSMAGGNPAHILKTYNPHTRQWEKPAAEVLSRQEIPCV